MHSYQHNIKTFNNATRHLTRVERSLYRDLIELYYDSQQPLNAVDLGKLCRLVLANSDEEKESLRYVLGEFFILSGDVYTHHYCDEQIEKYQKYRHWASKLTKGQRNAIQAARNASKISATPKWLTKEHWKQIEDIYAHAQFMSSSTGEPYEVDHIVPLRGKTACGLHTPWNLRVVTAETNRRKSNLELIA